MTDRADVSKRVSSFIATELVPDAGASLSLDTTLLGLVDSAGFMELLSFLEEEFGVEMDHVDIDEDTLGSVRSIADMVIRKTGGEGARWRSSSSSS